MQRKLGLVIVRQDMFSLGDQVMDRVQRIGQDLVLIAVGAEDPVASGDGADQIRDLCHYIPGLQADA